MNTTLCNDPDWTQRYENLRQHFLGEPGRLQSSPLGMLMFLREGLAGWMRKWNPEPPSSVQTLNPSIPSVGNCGWQRELIFLLAHLTTLHLQPTAA